MIFGLQTHVATFAGGMTYLFLPQQVLGFAVSETSGGEEPPEVEIVPGKRHRKGIGKRFRRRLRPG